MNANKLKALKGGRKVTMLTAYDSQMARIQNNAGVDMILVGDSLGMVVLGYKDTKQVTMNDMIRHTEAVARGVERAHIVADMPINSFDTVEGIADGSIGRQFRGHLDMQRGQLHDRIEPVHVLLEEELPDRVRRVDEALIHRFTTQNVFSLG